jgi:formate dehydrogenase iron-sulfur subunit
MTAAGAAPVRVFVPGDASACSLGADATARAIEAEAARAGRAVNIVRNGSRGLFWLEPMVEVVTAAGRVAYASETSLPIPGSGASSG